MHFRGWGLMFKTLGVGIDVQLLEMKYSQLYINVSHHPTKKGIFHLQQIYGLVM